MKSFVANCPSCGGPVEFRISESMVAICEFCHSAVARTNKKIEDHGKVAELLETRSPLELGVTGKFKNRKFEIVGRVQYQHPAGGVWDEWYLAMPGNEVGWLAEAQGRFYLLMRKPARILGRSVDFDSLQVGESLDLGSKLGSVQVAEKGTAVAGAAAGEIPWNFTPGAPHQFADLAGPNGVFGTIEFGEKSGDRTAAAVEDESADGGYSIAAPSKAALSVFLGREVTLADLGITVAADEDKGVRRTQAVTVNCPNCGGPLDLVAPDKTERVGCPNCKALLDCNQGDLKYLSTLKGKKVEMLIPLGKSGVIDGVSWTIIGFMERYVVYEGAKYRWTEYLLYNAASGFRWLVNSERHWSFVTPVSPGDVRTDGIHANWRDKRFRLFQKGTAHVSYVVGEFYWRVEMGETAETKDYVSPPLMLSFEGSGTDRSSEMNVSVGRYMPHEDVEAVFGVKDLPRSFSVSPNQPAPAVGRIMLRWLAFAGVMLLLYMVGSSGLFKQPADGWLFIYGLFGVSFLPICALVYRQSFEFQRWANSDYSPYAQGDDS